MSTPIDFRALLGAAGLLDPNLRLVLALRGVDGTGRSGAVFWGEAGLFGHPDVVELDINVLDGSWLFLDLNRFKPINDQHGHDIGDRALCAVVDRLSGLVRNSDTVARVGGDEFVILLGRVSSAEDAIEVAKKIVNALA